MTQTRDSRTIRTIEQGDSTTRAIIRASLSISSSRISLAQETDMMITGTTRGMVETEEMGVTRDAGTELHNVYCCLNYRVLSC